MFNRTLHQFSKSRKQDRVLPRSLEPDRAVDKGRAPARSGVVTPRRHFRFCAANPRTVQTEFCLSIFIGRSSSDRAGAA
jgi:hypothetical protein